MRPSVVADLASTDQADCRRGSVVTTGDWASFGPVPDILSGFEAVTLDVGTDDEGPVVATLVRRLAGAQPSKSAVLYVHGYNDYFFQTHLADYWHARGTDFYALDLRKSGRSLRPGQTPFFMTDVAQFDPELDAAMAVIGADGHDTVVINAHSTGGLIAVLWLHDRERRTVRSSDPTVAGVVLNSPFLALDPGPRHRAAAAHVAERVAQRRPYAVLPTGSSDLYVRSIHRELDGDWEFDRELKPTPSTPIRAGWLAGIRKAQRRVHAGLALSCPTLVLCSTRTVRVSSWTPEMRRGDAVLNADQIARWSTALGSHVTCIRIPDGMHDLVLSDDEPRAATFRAMTRWMDAYAC